THADSATLAALLAHPDAWWRETAQRLLIERHDASAAPAIRGVLAGNGPPPAHAHALWTLEGLAVLEDADILRGLPDSEAGVRENAVRRADPRLTHAREPRHGP